jgi:molybdopterin-guanine dinucleotide biosynthesis protein A
LPLIDHVIMGLFRATDHLVISGRDWRDFEALPDDDHAGEGPLAGLLAALRLAEVRGFAGVLSAACDALPVPDLAGLVGGHPAVIEGHWLFGYWPSPLAGRLTEHLASGADRSVRSWIARCEARLIPPAMTIHNLNTRTDVAEYERSLI